MPGGGQQPQQIQETKNVLGPEQKRIFDLAFPKLESFAATVPRRYNGTAIAGFNPNQIAGQEAVLDSTGAQQGVVQGGADASRFWTSGNVWDPVNNPALSGAVDAATRPITQAYTNEFLPAVRSEAIRAGGLGGSRQGVTEALGAEKAARAVGDTASKVVQGAYDTNVRAQLQAMGLVPTIAQSQTIPGVTMSGVGDVQQAQEQTRLNETIANFNYDQLAPFLQAKELVGLVQGMPGGSTVSTANNPPPPSGIMQALGGAATGATLGGALLPGFGALPGAALGGLLPFLMR